MMRRLAIFLFAFFLTTALPAQTNNAVVDPEVEEVIRGSLKYLASQQAPNGSWSANGSCPIAMTGYVLMSFLATGNLPNEGAYSRNVANGVLYLLDAVQSNGMFEPRHDSKYMYGHGIATIALAEVYGQTKAENIRPKLEKLVKLILTSQNKHGGWRYRPESTDDDISVTVLQLVALRAAKNAGLDVPRESLEKAVEYVRSCHNQATGGFSYGPHGLPGFARTAAGIYSLQVCGQYDDPFVKSGSDYLLKHGDDKEWFAYGHFYAGPTGSVAAHEQTSEQAHASRRGN